MILPMISLNERGNAQSESVFQLRVSPVIPPCNAPLVMVAQFWARGFSPVRYPSPAGLGGDPQGCRPCFFPATEAGQTCCGGSTDRSLILSLKVRRAAKTAPEQIKRGKEACGNSQNWLWSSARRQRSRAAVTHLQNKRSWAAVLGLRPRLSPRVIWPQARSLALRPTWPTARNSRHAADGLSGAQKRAAKELKAIFGPRARGWLFAFATGAARAPQGPRGDINV